MFRFTEQDLREFLEHHRKLWVDECIDAQGRDDDLEVMYARGAYEAYEFVLRFLDEYKLEEDK